MAPPTTPRRVSTRKVKTPPKKTNDVGSPLGPHDTNSVRDRVRQWQAQGGGVIVAIDPLAEVENDESRRRNDQTKQRVVSEKLHEEPTATNESPTPKRKSGRRKDKVEESTKARVRSVSAPRKRIVSDEHWVKKKSTPVREKEAVEKRSIPSWALPDDGIRVRPVASTSELGEEESFRHMSVSEERKTTSKKLDDGIRVYRTPPSSRKPSEYLRPLAQDEGMLSIQGEHHSTPNSRAGSIVQRRPTALPGSKEVTPERSPTSAHSSPGEQEEIRKKDREQRKERVHNSSPRLDYRPSASKKEPRKPNHGKILSNVISGSKKIFMKSEPAPMPAPKTPSIESWLDNTADPFLDEDHALYVETAARPPDTVIAESIFHGDEHTDDEKGFEHEDETADEPPVEIPAPLKPSRRRKRSSAESKKTEDTKATEDPNRIWDSISQRDTRSHRQDSRRRRRARTVSVPAEGPIEEISEPPEATEDRKYECSESTSAVAPTVQIPKLEESPPSLRRRGARRDSSTSASPTKARERRQSSPLKESFTPTEESQRETVREKGDVLSRNRTMKNNDAKSSPGVQPSSNNQRTFPSLGRPLSTIASVESFNTRMKDEPVTADVDGNRLGDLGSDPQSGAKYEIPFASQELAHHHSLSRKISTSHSIKDSDLISLLSAPRAESKSLRPSRSVRSKHSIAESVTIQDLLVELRTGESKYMRELQTLLDGVIPVLLSSVLSKSDSAITAGLFSPTRPTQDSVDLTKPICDMGVALERLKRAHKRISLTSIDSFFTWAHGVKVIYKDYFKAWRMGFQDVIVNLAPATDATSAETAANNSSVLPQNEQGDVIGENGERVDVAYLLKRPLIRVKQLWKIVKQICMILPSPEASVIAATFEELTADARNRSSEERERIEDEAAAAIDPTRARDPKTLGPLAGVNIDPTRRVKARDIFDMTLLHTSGQRVDCRIEMFFRENASNSELGGDVLICEVDNTERWLLFPPIQTSKVSARNGDQPGEVVIMLRGTQTGGQEWHELLLLRIDDEQTGFEWVQMLGLEPIPPNIMRTHSFIARAERNKTLSLGANVPGDTYSQALEKTATPSPRELEVPFGERATGSVETWVESPNRQAPLIPTKPQIPVVTESLESVSEVSTTPVAASRGRGSLPSLKGSQGNPELPQTPMSVIELSHSNGSPTIVLKRTGANRRSKYFGDSKSNIASPKSQSQSPTTSTDKPESHSSSILEPVAPSTPPPPPPREPRPKHHRSSSVPSLYLPIIPKVRKDSPPTTPVHEPEEEPSWPTVEPSTSSKKPLKKQRLPEPEEDEKPPPPPPHRTPSPAHVGGVPVPDLSPSAVSRGHRRTSSPLKHEYEPSTATESGTETETDDSDTETVEHNYVDSGVASWDELEDEDVAMPLASKSQINRRAKSSARQHSEGYSSQAPPRPETIYPSSSASQAGDLQDQPQAIVSRTAVATPFCWFPEKGSWESMYHQECMVVVTGGLVEVFDMVEYHIKSRSGGVVATTLKPLLALEVAPVVGLRRGTALDLTLRNEGGGVQYMFRSRSPEECEILYGYIDWSRKNNEKYEQLLRDAFGPKDYGGAKYNGNSSTKKRSRFLGIVKRRNSFRARSHPSRSAPQSERTAGSVHSAWSVFKHLSGKSTGFSIARSTITSRQGSRANSTYTASDNTGGSGTSTPIPGVPDGLLGQGEATPLGLSNIKIKFRVREGENWRSLGAAFLTIVRPREADDPLTPGIVGGESGPEPGGIPESAQNGINTVNRQNLNGKRIIIVAKQSSKHEKEGREKIVLLDTILGEDSFEKQASRGIVLAVTEEHILPTNTGGVGITKTTKYSLEFASRSEAQYVFSIVSKNRYAPLTE